MLFDPKNIRLQSYAPRAFQVSCTRCQRRADVQTAVAKRKFGDVSLAEAATQIAKDAGCVLASDPKRVLCSAVTSEAPVHWWANLYDARIGNWQGFLSCRRRFAGLKPIKPKDACPEYVPLDVLSLSASFGGDFPLERLPRKLRCPYCQSDMVDVDWAVPSAPDPGGTSEKAAEPAMLRFRTQGGSAKLRVIESDPGRPRRRAGSE